MKDKDWRELFQNEKKRVHLRYYMKERVKNAVQQKGKGRYINSQRNTEYRKENLVVQMTKEKGAKRAGLFINIAAAALLLFFLGGFYWNEMRKEQREDLLSSSAEPLNMETILQENHTEYVIPDAEEAALSDEYYYPSYNDYQSMEEVPYPQKDDIYFLRPTDFQTEWRKVYSHGGFGATSECITQILNMEYVDTLGPYPSEHYISDEFSFLAEDGTLARSEFICHHTAYLFDPTHEEETIVDLRILAVDVEVTNLSDQAMEYRYGFCSTILYEDPEWGKYSALQHLESEELPFWVTPYSEGFPIFRSVGDFTDSNGHFISVSIEPGASLRYRLGFLVDANRIEDTYIWNTTGTTPEFYYLNHGRYKNGTVIYPIPDLPDEE